MVPEIIFGEHLSILDEPVVVGKGNGQHAVHEAAIVQADALDAVYGADIPDFLNEIVPDLRKSGAEELVGIDIGLVFGRALPVPVHAEPVGMLRDDLRPLLARGIQRPNPRVHGDSVPPRNLHILPVVLDGSGMQHDGVQAGFLHMGESRFHVDVREVFQPGPEHRVFLRLFLRAGGAENEE